LPVVDVDALQMQSLIKSLEHDKSARFDTAKGRSNISGPETKSKTKLSV
jgi:hypothetical protein